MAYHLATNPEDRARLTSDSSLHMGAIEELIRYYAAIVALGRTAKKDAVVAGQKIAEGDFLMLSYAAASRDPQMFESPNEIDIERKITVNPAFSFGPHRCIGSHIARLEARLTLEQLLRRMPDLAVAAGQQPTYSNSTITRNMDSLPLVFTPGAREG
jgi:cytochrome P450